MDTHEDNRRRSQEKLKWTITESQVKISKGQYEQQGMGHNYRRSCR